MFWIWDPDPEMFSLGGFSVGWYGMLFALGFLLSQRLVIFMYRREERPGKDLDALLFTMIAGTVVGARLGHCLFYDPSRYLAHPLEILRVWEGGLSSHGAAAGILAALWVFSRRTKDQPFLWLVDRIAIVAALTGALVRVGNFVNTEVMGKPTFAGYGVVFARPARTVLESLPDVAGVRFERWESERALPGRVPLLVHVDVSPAQAVDAPNILLKKITLPLWSDSEVQRHMAMDRYTAPQFPAVAPGERFAAVLPASGVARHPAQLYEALVCALLSAGLFAAWWRKRGALRHGVLLGWFLVLIFTSRFFLEYVKEAAAPLEADLPLKLGQLLSIPFVLAGLWVLWRSRAKGSTP